MTALFASNMEFLPFKIIGYVISFVYIAVGVAAAASVGWFIKVAFDCVRDVLSQRSDER